MPTTSATRRGSSTGWGRDSWSTAAAGSARTPSSARSPNLLARKDRDRTPSTREVIASPPATSASACTSCHGQFADLQGPVRRRRRHDRRHEAGDCSGSSLSPNRDSGGFRAHACRGSDRCRAVWTTAADGHPTYGGWSGRATARSGRPPAIGIAYLAPAGPARWAWRLVAPQGGASTTLLRHGPGTVFRLVPERPFDRLPGHEGEARRHRRHDRKVRRLLKLQLPYSSSSVVWSPNSQQLLIFIAPARPAGDLPQWPVASPDRQHEATPSSRLLTPAAPPWRGFGRFRFGQRAGMSPERSAHDPDASDQTWRRYAIAPRIVTANASAVYLSARAALPVKR